MALSRRGLRAARVAGCVLAWLSCGPAPASAGDVPGQPAASAPSDAFDPLGLRRWTSHGVTFGLVYTNDTLANLRGGDRRGTVNQGLADVSAEFDLERLVGRSGLALRVQGYLIHNTGFIRRDYVGGINTVAAIEAVPTARLSELWLEQTFWDGRAKLRFGQLTADTEFFYVPNAAFFLQNDWPTIMAYNQAGGGPAYPLSTPGVRLQLDPVGPLSLLFGVYNGDPAGAAPGEEQLRNRYGVNFRVRDPALLLAEIQLRANRGPQDTGLARTVKFGGWMQRKEFPDQRWAGDGRLLADPASSGRAALRRGNGGVYGVIEQQLYRPAGGDPDSGISAFGRVSVSPSDRNLVDLYVDGGIIVAGLVPGRPADRFGVSAMLARFSDGVRAFEADRAAFAGIAPWVRDQEINLELTYLAKMAPGWTLQPVLTKIWHPDGNAARDALVTGLRSMWRF